MKPYYDDGSCVIYHGRAEEILPEFEIGVAEIVFTSPPYNLGISTGGSFPRGKSFGRWAGGDLASGYGEHRDAMPWLEYTAWQQEVLRECWRIVGEAGAIFYNHKARVQAGVQLHPRTFLPPECIIRQEIVWARGGGINAAPTHYCPTYELILLLAKPAFRLKSKGASTVGDVWRVAARPNTDHPAPFPIELPAQALETTAAASVLDPFMGSGTTLRAAKDAGARGVGIELEERWCEYAAQRLGQEVLDLGAAA